MFLGELDRMAGEIAAAYKATRDEMRDVQGAHDRSLVHPSHTARVTVDGQQFIVKDEGAGRLMKPVRRKSQVTG